ncbi:dynein heavy chain, partial [Thraustotheca clavata]
MDTFGIVPEAPRRRKKERENEVQYDGKEDKNLLMDRIYAKGIKRSIAQAQMHQKESGKKHFGGLQPLAGMLGDGENQIAPRKPVPPSGKKIPQLNLGFHVGQGTSSPRSARNVVEMTPLSARDEFYIGQHRPIKKRNIVQVAPPIRVAATKNPLDVDCDDDEHPKRSQLLHNSTKLKTFTESVQESILSNGVPKDSFLYLVCVEDNPYKLVVVDHDSINPNDYYTMSRAGITHFCDGVPEFTYLETFEREHYMFSLVRKIPFFKKYRAWKQFRTWKKNVRACKTLLCKHTLTQELFILRPSLNGALMELRHLCYAMSQLRLFSIDAKKTYTLSDFSELQQNQMVHIDGQIDTYVASIAETTRQTSNKYLREFLTSNGFTTADLLPENVSDILALMTQAPEEDDDDDEDKPIVHKKVEKATWQNGRTVTYTERAAMRTQCRRITKLIRLIEFFVVDAFLLLGISSTEYLLDEMRHIITLVHEEQNKINKPSPGKKLILHNAPPPAVPLFRVEVHLHLITLHDQSMRSQLLFEPSCEELRAEIESVIFAGLKATTARDRLMSHEEFKTYIQPTLDELSNGELSAGLNLDMMVMEDANFQDMIQGINTLLTKAYDGMQTFTKSLATFQTQYIENIAFMKLAKDIDHPNNLARSIDELRDQLETYTTQIAQFNTLADTAVVGLILADCRALNATLKPSPTECMKCLHNLIPRIAQFKNEELMQEVSKANDAISAIPTTVDEFADALGALRDTQANMAALDDRYMFLKQLYGLTDEFKIAVSDIDSTNAFMLAQKRAQLKTSMDLLDSSTEAYTEKFAKELDRKIPKLLDQIKDRYDELHDVKLTSTSSDASDMLVLLQNINDRLSELEALGAKYIGFQKVLGLPQSSFEDLETLRSDLETKKLVWSTVLSWNSSAEIWRETILNQVAVAEMDEKVLAFYKTTLVCERGLPANDVVRQLKDSVESFKEALPIVADLRCLHLKDRHWLGISEALKFDIVSNTGLTLGRFVDMHLHELAPTVNRIATEATQEALLENMLCRITSLWNEIEFEVKNHNDRKDVYVLGSTEDVISSLEESLITMNTILASRFVEPVRDEALVMHKRLVGFQETLDEWMTCQREWIYLESIFSAPDIQRQLPQEAQTFAVINTFWKEFMIRTHETPHCMKATAQPGLYETLLKHNASLEKMRKSLEDYLETKRQAFPRFYFLSNDELLEILAHTKEPHAVQPHLCKLFDGILRLEFGEVHGSVDILSMNSIEGERVPFGRNLKARGNVEDWLSAVQANMKNSLHRSMKACLGDYDHSQRDTWIFHHPAQCVASVSYMIWARECEAALSTGLEKWHRLMLTQLAALTRLIRSPLTRLQRAIVSSLVTTDVHARDIVEELMQLNVRSTTDFNWKKQLRYGWSTDVDDVTIQQSNVSIRYGYEYMGACSRLVITPLTDRCWMTITGAYDLRLGASPSGPAGTGKTETSKDLAKALAIQCIVFNCSDQIDFKIMAKLFCGLAQCGCWTCLDEFNRIDIEVLSVIAQQLMILRHGRLTGATDIAFEGRNIALKDHHVIVTMNPGYAGRTELPDNLKICFRPISMMVPDYSLIAEIMMFSEGFDNAKDLSKKITKLYKLCSEQLSQQTHYDFGMRAVKTVLVMAGGLKRQSTPSTSSASEEVVLIRALREANTPKFVEEDLRLFKAILGDLFPNIHVPESPSSVLEEAIQHRLKTDGLQEVPAFTRRSIELFETLQVRIGVVLTGCSGSGKTTCYTTLRKTMCDLREVKGSADKRFQKVVITVLNPKCVSLGELYGSFHPLTREWKDGLASALMRLIITGTVDSKTGTDKESLPWLMFDGPIDALWIENLNTVLDDNMTLCLASGERIRLLPQMRLLFEVSDMNSASPASVSRLGVLYFSHQTLGWRPYVETWLTETFGTEIEPKFSSHKLRSRVSKAFDLLLDSPASPACCNRIRSQIIPSTYLSSVINACDLFSILFLKQKWFSTASSEKQNKSLDMLLVFSVLWSFGANLDEDNAFKFNDQFVTLIHEHKSQFHSSLLQVCGKSCGGPTSCMGSGASRTVAMLYDFCIDFNDLAWSHWENHLTPFEYNMYTPIFNMTVPTVDVTKYSYLFTQLVSGMKPVFLTGETGGGKTVIAHAVLDTLALLGDDQGVGIIPLYIHFSAQTSSAVTQATIEAKLTKKRKTLLGAPVNKKVVVFVDDINLPAADVYGTQPCIELIRQLLDHHGFYDRDKYFWKDVADTVITAAGGPPGGGRQNITQRLMKHFTIFSLPAGHEDAMRVIFNAVMMGHTGSFAFAPAIRDTLLQSVEATIRLYVNVCENLRPTPSKCHYLFNLRDVVKVFAGLLHSRPAFTLESTVKLWMHECLRVFYDRLVNETDRLWLSTTLISLVNKHFRMGWTHDNIFGSEDSIPALFGCYGSGTPKDYEEIVDMQSLESLLNTYVEDYNTFHTPHMQLIFFRDTILHISSMTRVLMQPRGNAMLVGVGGSGKRSMAKLAASMMDVRCFEIELARNYGRNEFREDLKKLLQATGVKGKETMFLLTDNQIVCEEFIEDINSLLNAGEIPHLFTHEEYEAILTDMKPVASQNGLEDTRANAELLFVQRVRNHLHIVLCLSPVGSAFRYRCRQFPSLINCMTIDWYEEWPETALLVVAESYLS